MSASKIHPSAIISAKAELGKNVSIGPYCVIDDGVVLDDDVVLHAQTHIMGKTFLGKRCEVYPFAVLGAPPQDFSYCNEDTSLRIGSDTIIREHVTMHRGTVRGRSETIVGSHGYFMAGSHVAHDCIIADHVTFTHNALAGGHVVIGDHCILGAQSAVHQFSHIGHFAFVGSSTIVTRDIIPFGLVHQHRASLAGLNIIGLKRNNFSRKKIHTMRSAFSMLFLAPGLFDAKVESVTKEFKDCEEVMQIIDFIRDKNRTRALCLADGE